MGGTYNPESRPELDAASLVNTWQEVYNRYLLLQALVQDHLSAGHTIDPSNNYQPEPISIKDQNYLLSTLKVTPGFRPDNFNFIIIITHLDQPLSYTRIEKLETTLTLSSTTTSEQPHAHPLTIGSKPSYTNVIIQTDSPVEAASTIHTPLNEDQSSLEHIIALSDKRAQIFVSDLIEFADCVIRSCLPTA